MSVHDSSGKGWLRLQVRVSLLTDLHCGSGLGGAGIDRTVASDRRGCPVIRWSHWRGKLLQALRDREQALCIDDSRLQQVLFGASGESNASRGALKGTSLRFETATGTSTTVVWPSTAMKEGLRAPQEETYRQIEYVAAGREFTGELRLPAKMASEFERVKGLLKRLPGLGSGGSRGDGRVHIQLTEVPRPKTGVSPATDDAPPFGDVPSAVRVLLEAVEPICLGASSSFGTTVHSHSHVPGPGVAGMLTAFAIRNGEDALAVDLLEQRLQCGPAYPIPADVVCSDVAKVDVLPMPLAVHVTKPSGQTGRLPWWVDDEVGADYVDTLARLPPQTTYRRDGPKLKRPGEHDYLFTVDGTDWYRHTCTPKPSLHNDAGQSRTRQAKQNLYAVEELPEHTRFVATIKAMHGEPQARLLRILNWLQRTGEWLHAGRGGSPLRVVAAAPVTAQALPTEGVEGASVFVMTVSELVLRAADLRFHERLDMPGSIAMLRAAGASDALIARLAACESHSSSVVIRGRNVATGSARLPVLGIRRGSCVRLDFDDAAAAAECARMLRERDAVGIGERRAEGFGRLRVGWPVAVGELAASGERAQPNENEVNLARVRSLLRESGVPAYMPASRWQALRDAASRPAAVADWRRSTDRWLDARLEQPAERTSASRWLDELFDRYLDDPEFLRLLARHAAKNAARAASRGNRPSKKEH